MIGITTINLRLQVNKCVLFHKNILMLEYEQIDFNWFEHITKSIYFLQTSQLHVCNRNYFQDDTLKLALIFCLKTHSNLDI